MSDHIDTYFGVDVPDPYRWMEDDMSDETADWVSNQNIQLSCSNQFSIKFVHKQVQD